MAAKKIIKNCSELAKIIESSPVVPLETLFLLPVVPGALPIFLHFQLNFLLHQLLPLLLLALFARFHCFVEFPVHFLHFFSFFFWFSVLAHLLLHPSVCCRPDQNHHVGHPPQDRFDLFPPGHGHHCLCRGFGRPTYVMGKCRCHLDLPTSKK